MLELGNQSWATLESQPKFMTATPNAGEARKSAVPSLSLPVAGGVGVGGPVAGAYRLIPSFPGTPGTGRDGVRSTFAPGENGTECRSRADSEQRQREAAVSGARKSLEAETSPLSRDRARWAT